MLFLFYFLYETQGEPEASQVPDEGTSPEVHLKKNNNYICRADYIVSGVGHYLRTFQECQGAFE